MRVWIMRVRYKFEEIGEARNLRYRPMCETARPSSPGIPLLNCPGSATHLVYRSVNGDEWDKMPAYVCQRCHDSLKGKQEYQDNRDAQAAASLESFLRAMESGS